MDIRPEPSDTDEPASRRDEEGLQPKGIRAMQGPEPSDSSSDHHMPNKDMSASDEDSDNLKLDQNQMIDMDEEIKKAQDPSNLQYRLGSPHADYKAYKDLEAAKRQHDLGQEAALAGNVSQATSILDHVSHLAGAIATTRVAKKEAEGSEDSPMDQYFRKKYGPHPYTEEANSKNEEEA
jgi:hypothetical protein